MTDKIIALNPGEEKTKSSKILLFTCVGPILLMLALIAVSLMKVILPIYLGTLAAITLVAIFFLSLKGLILGWILETCFLAYYLSNGGTYEGPALLAAAISFSLSHVIFLLGTYEAKSLVETLEVESKSRLSALWKLEEKARIEEKSFQHERAKFTSKGEQENFRVSLEEKTKAFDKLKKEKEDLAAALLKLNSEKVERLDKSAENVASLKLELEEARLELDLSEKEELRLKNLQEEMSGHIDRLQSEQDVLTDALFKGEELSIQKDEEITDLKSTVEKLSLKSQEIEGQFSEINDRFKEKEFVLRGIVQEAHAKNAQLEREIKEQKLKIDSIISENESQIAKLAATNSSSQLERELVEQKLEKESLTEKILELEENLAAYELSRERVLEEQKLEKESLTAKIFDLEENLKAKLAIAEPSYEKESKKVDVSAKERDKFKALVAELKALRKDDSKKIKEIQGQYRQLQQQFDKKSESLDDSRKALFHMQEKLFTYQREAEELPQNGRSEIETHLEDQIKKMEDERNLLVKEHLDEVESLQDVIEALMQKS